MLPLELMFGWYIRVVKDTLGGLKGKSTGNRIDRKNTPPRYGE